MANGLSKGALEEYKEHKKTLQGHNGHSMAKKIAADHLKEDPDYYSESKEKKPKMADTKKWMQAARDKMEKKGTVGSLHTAAGVPQGKTISEDKLSAVTAHAKSMKGEDGKLNARGRELMQKVNFARNAGK